MGAFLGNYSESLVSSDLQEELRKKLGTGPAPRGEELMSIAQKHEFPSDILHCMVAKISRRLHKLDGALTSRWLQKVEEVLSSTQNNIKSRWKSIIKKSRFYPDLNILADLEFQRDTCAAYPELDSFLR